MLHWQYYMVFDTVQSIYSINIRVGECIEIGRRIHESVNAAPKRIQCVALWSASFGEQVDVE